MAVIEPAPFSFKRRGLPERPDICVNDFRPAGVPETTSMPVISMPSGYVVVISDRSESQRPKGLVRRFLRYSQALDYEDNRN